jgi:hypothetical protein
MASFDVKRVTPLEWAGIGAGVLAFIFSFFTWVSASVEGLEGLGLSGSVSSGSAWDAGFLAWFSVLLLVAAAVVVALPHFGTQVPNRAMIWLILSGLAVVFIVLRWLTYSSNDAFGVSFGAGFGTYIGLLLAVVSGVAAFLTFRASSRTNA